jgi:molybdenum cofactor synthesis domain-containing protein
VNDYVKEGIDLIIFTGGTGLSGRDVTPESLEDMIERKIPGIEEAIRAYGQQRTPYSMLSRSVVGTIQNSLVMAIPGSTNGAKESMDAVFPAVLHVFGILKGSRHD